MEKYCFRIFGYEMDKGEIGVIKKPIVTWTNSAGREFTWGYIGMPVNILRQGRFFREYEIVDLDGAAAPIIVAEDLIEKIKVVWRVIK